MQDCRSGNCIRGYLYYNGYIPANQINVSNGVMGVPSNYTPSNQPIYPTPAHPNPSDPNYALYGTNLVSVPLQNGTSVRIAYNNGLNPWRNQVIPGPTAPEPGYWDNQPAKFQQRAAPVAVDSPLELVVYSHTWRLRRLTCPNRVTL